MTEGTNQEQAMPIPVRTMQQNAAGIMVRSIDMTYFSIGSQKSPIESFGPHGSKPSGVADPSRFATLWARLKSVAAGSASQPLGRRLRLPGVRGLVVLVFLLVAMWAIPGLFDSVEQRR